MPIERRAKITERIKVNRNKLIKGTGISASLLGLCYVSRIEKVPTTGRRRFRLFSDEQYAQLSSLQFDIMLRRMDRLLLDEDNFRCKRVKAIAIKIIEANKHRFPDAFDHNWTLTVVDMQLKNAFVTGTGNIIIFRGMVDFCKTDGELAAILSHEMSHVLLGHGAEVISHKHLSDLLLAPLLLPIWFMMSSLFLAAIVQGLLCAIVHIATDLPYSRKLELEADEVGLQICARSCYDVRESVAFWMRIETDRLKDLGLIPEDPDTLLNSIEFLATHPSHSSRKERLDSLLDEAIKLRDSCKCPALPVDDPRIRALNERNEFRLKQEEHRKRHVIQLKPHDSP